MNGRKSDEMGLSWLAGLIALPLMLLCCGGPLIVAALASLGLGAWLEAHGLLVVGGLALAVAAGLAVWWALRRPRSVDTCCPPATPRTSTEQSAQDGLVAPPGREQKAGIGAGGRRR